MKGDERRLYLMSLHRQARRSNVGVAWKLYKVPKSQHQHSTLHIFVQVRLSQQYGKGLYICCHFSNKYFLFFRIVFEHLLNEFETAMKNVQDGSD